MYMCVCYMRSVYVRVFLCIVCVCFFYLYYAQLISLVKRPNIKLYKINNQNHNHYIDDDSHLACTNINVIFLLLYQRNSNNNDDDDDDELLPAVFFFILSHYYKHILVVPLVPSLSRSPSLSLYLSICLYLYRGGEEFPNPHREHYLPLQLTRRWHDHWHFRWHGCYPLPMPPMPLLRLLRCRSCCCCVHRFHRHRTQ